jgi:hypothetical protein
MHAPFMHPCTLQAPTHPSCFQTTVASWQVLYIEKLCQTCLTGWAPKRIVRAVAAQEHGVEYDEAGAPLHQRKGPRQRERAGAHRLQADRTTSGRLEQVQALGSLVALRYTLKYMLLQYSKQIAGRLGGIKASNSLVALRYMLKYTDMWQCSTQVAVRLDGIKALTASLPCNKR